MERPEWYVELTFGYYFVLSVLCEDFLLLLNYNILLENGFIF